MLGDYVVQEFQKRKRKKVEKLYQSDMSKEEVNLFLENKLCPKIEWKTDEE